MTAVPTRLLSCLVCPTTKEPLRLDGSVLVSPSGRRYPVVDGVPVLIPDRDDPTIWMATASKQAAWSHLDCASDQPTGDQSTGHEYGGLFAETLGVSEEERAKLRDLIDTGPHPVDPVASVLVGATCGLAYSHLIGALRRYPIPELPLPDGEGRRLVDIGCSWGRWSIAAARKGYDVIALDPSLGAVMAARRIARSLGLQVNFVVGDARNLPFESGTLDTAFSYSVLQHFAKADARDALAEIGRVLVPGGLAKVEMPNRLGLRSQLHQIRRGFREADGFEVRYWSTPELRDAFETAIGSTRISADCFFGLNLQYSDVDLMRPTLKLVMTASEMLRRASTIAGPVVHLADSVFCTAIKQVSAIEDRRISADPSTAPG